MSDESGDQMWLHKLHTRLSQAQKHTQNELNVSLEQLFNGKPDNDTTDLPVVPTDTPQTLTSWLSKKSAQFFKKP